jgi:hypothetical protein
MRLNRRMGGVHASPAAYDILTFRLRVVADAGRSLRVGRARPGAFALTRQV